MTDSTWTDDDTQTVLALQRSLIFDLQRTIKRQSYSLGVLVALISFNCVMLFTMAGCAQ